MHFSWGMQNPLPGEPGLRGQGWNTSLLLPFSAGMKGSDLGNAGGPLPTRLPKF